MELTLLPPRPRWRGFSFALHPTRCRAFLLHRCNIATYKRLQCVFPFIHPTPQNSLQGFAAVFPAIVHTQPPTILDQHNKRLHHLRHAGAHTRAWTRSAYTGYHRHAGTLCRPAQAAYYNKVYKRADHASGGGSAPTVCGSLASADTLSVAQTRRTC